MNDNLRRLRRRERGRPVVTYVRAATVQDIEAQALKLQRDICGRYAAARGWEIVAEFGDVASGATDRPGLQALLAFVAAGETSCVVVSDLSRLSGNRNDLARLRAAIEGHAELHPALEELHHGSWSFDDVRRRHV